MRQRLPSKKIPEISIIIITRNRSSQIKECIKSLLKSSFQNYQILIADQSTDEQTVEVIQSFQSSKISIIHMDTKGKARGLNILVKMAASEIITFTDDDCVVSENWLMQILEVYKRHDNLAGVFGNTYSYQPELHPLHVCPLTFITKKFSLHTFSTLHHYYVGLGNNMSLRKTVLNEVGGFQEWLGPGTMAGCGEESDIIFRILKQGYTIATDPHIIVFHDRWLSPNLARQLQAHYSRGFISFLSSYLFTNDHSHVWTFIRMRMNEKVFSAFQRCYYSPAEFFREYHFVLEETLAIVEGMSIGIVMAISKRISNMLRVSAQ